MSVARGTVHSIQFLRFVAASVVVLFHSYVGFLSQLPTDATGAAGYWFRFGAVGVHVFFVISGYIMYLTNFARPGRFAPGRFLIRRLIRVYPTYWVFLALYLAAEALLGALPVLTTGEAAGALVLAPADAPRVIGPAWTLSFEIYFYLVFGAVMALGRSRGLVVLTGLFVASAALGAVLRPMSSVAALVTNSLLLEFVAGVWIARLTAERVWPRALGWLALAGAVAGYAAGLIGGYERLPSAISWGVPSALLIAAAVVLEQTAGAGRGPIRRLSWLGDSSYSLYLGHTLVITLLVALFRGIGWVPPVAPLIAATALVCIALAALFYRGVEHPMIAALHRLLAPSRPAGVAPPTQAGQPDGAG